MNEARDHLLIAVYPQTKGSFRQLISCGGASKRQESAATAIAPASVAAATAAAKALYGGTRSSSRCSAAAAVRVIQPSVRAVPRRRLGCPVSRPHASAGRQVCCPAALRRKSSFIEARPGGALNSESSMLGHGEIGTRWRVRDGPANAAPVWARGISAVPEMHGSVVERAVSFFAFPKDPLLKKRWLVAIKRDEGKLFAVTKHTKVCSTHFANDDYLPNVVGGRRYLRVDAVPSVFAFGKPQRPARRKPRDRQQCVSRAQRLSAIGQAGSSELALETTLSPGGDVAVSRDCATADEVLDATECSDSASAPTGATDFQERQEVCGRTCAATVVNLEEQLSEHQANWKAI
ncbi:hypothetical protein HPB50_026162 [Hyalomma asiaticum]|uniref:Uncharacterized protein n=1 Tax=Hyalomma asiaticum TaxID=266040 RepID=A0ACB7SKY0_HYAAI|nr:hypothetical protein HPB50_026162 [Hyalomma asiaticum]